MCDDIGTKYNKIKAALRLEGLKQKRQAFALFRKEPLGKMNLPPRASVHLSVN
jgi:hypothetical protein